MIIYNTILLDRKITSILRNFGFSKDFKFHLLYIIFHIRTYPFKNRAYSSDDYIPINLEFLRRLISRDYAGVFLKKMVEEGVLETNSTYLSGKYATGYRLTEKYRNSKFYAEEITDKKLLSKIRKVYVELKNEVLIRKDGYSYVTECMEFLTLDETLAKKFVIDYIKTAKKRESYNLVIDNFKDKFAKVDTTSYRLHNNLTNISTELRQFLSYNGENLVQCDLKSAQPMLFISVLDKFHIPIEEKEKYLDVVCNIGFYEFFSDKVGYNLTDKNRTDFKRRVFGGVLFDENRSKLSKYEKAFQKEFPIIFMCMREMKKDNYKSVAIALQKLESKFIFRCIDLLREENNSIELMTVHDSIVTVCGKEDIVYRVMMEEYQKMFGILPNIKVEKFA